MLGIVKKMIYMIIQLLFASLMLVIAIATILLDKNVQNAFPNTVIYANGGYYLLALLILIIVFSIWGFFGQVDISKKKYTILMIIFPLVVWGGVQIPIGKWIYWFVNAGDFGSIMYAAIGFNNGESFADWGYFLQSPNNANLAIVLSWIYKIFPNWRCILILGATLTNISAVLVSLTVKNITKSRSASLCVLVIAELLMAMTWRSFIVYTDNYGMIFVALIMWIYSVELDDKYKMPIIIFLAAVGTFIKMTIFICFLGIMIHKFCVQLKKKDSYENETKKIVLLGIIFIFTFGMMTFAQKSLRAYYGLDLTGQFPKGWQYLFMVGQNNDAYGVVNNEDPQIRSVLIEDAVEKNEDIDFVNQQFLAEALRRIKSRSIIGNIEYYTKKLNVAFNDGYFHNVQTSPENASNELERNIYYELLEKEDGKYYQIYAGVLQISWDFVLLLLMLSVVLLYKSEKYKLFEILILGITAYLMLFEGRSKYLYMFLPVFVSAAGISFAEINTQLLILKKDMVLVKKNSRDVKKKTVGIITFHFVNNFGGVLQAYALQKVVERECNVEVEIIDYRNWFIRLTDRVRLLPITINLREILSGFKTMGQRIERRNKFGNFTRENNKLSKKYINHWEIIGCPPYDDKYICGSDQIWNSILTMGVDASYFLGFENDSNKKIAYAPSFGTSGISKKSERKIKRYLESIGYLSVREKSGQMLIKEMTGRNVERLIDPTFLLEKEEWGKIGTNPLNSDESYILLYIMQRDDKVYEYAKKIKEQKKLKLVEISRYGYQPEFVDRVLVDVGPAEFLRLFKDAAYICTNSYHGLVYSIIFEKDFCLIPCKRFKARINNILDLLQIEVPPEDNDRQKLTASYDRQFVRDVIEKERRKAINFLKESVNN